MPHKFATGGQKLHEMLCCENTPASLQQTSVDVGFSEVKSTFFAICVQASRQDIPAFRRELFDLYEDGQLKAWVDSRRFHGLEQVSDAIEYMLTGQAIGKVVVSF